MRLGALGLRGLRHARRHRRLAAPYGRQRFDGLGIAALFTLDAVPAYYK